jgi:hypothetical protein
MRVLQMRVLALFESDPLIVRFAAFQFSDNRLVVFDLGHSLFFLGLTVGWSAGLWRE